MRLTTRSSRRDGFTLIELLIVIGILALLAALTAAGIGRVRQGQHAATTEATVTKAQKALNQQLTAVIEESTSDKNRYLPYAVTYCDGDRDRAKALLSYAYAKRTFPQTFAEARAPLNIPGITLPGDAAFSSLPNSSGLPADQESAVLLYLIVTEMAKKGASSTGDAFSGATMALPGTNYTVLKDGYGTHLAFFRWYGAIPLMPEVQQPPYVVGSFSPDRFDPLRKLQTWSNVGSRSGALSVLNLPAGSPAVDFDGLNKVLTVVSAGPDKAFGTDDDVFGFRLAQYGAKGN